MRSWSDFQRSYEEISLMKFSEEKTMVYRNIVSNVQSNDSNKIMLKFDQNQVGRP